MQWKLLPARCCPHRSWRRSPSIGEERTAAVGDVLYRVGDQSYPFIAILEGEAAILDAAGQRDRPARRVGVPRRDEPADRADRLPDGGRHPAHALHRRRARRVCDRCSSTTARSATCCSRRSSPGARRCSGQGIGVEIVGPPSSEATMRMVDFAARATGCRTRGATRAPMTPRRERLDATSCRSCGCRAARSCAARRPARSRARWGSAASSRPERRSTCVVVGGGPAGLGRRGLRRVRGPRHARRREHRARRPGGLLAPDRELPRVPGRDQRRGAHRAVRSPRRASSTRAPATPYRAVVARAGERTPHRAAGGGSRDRRARRHPRHRRAVPPAAGRRARRLRGNQRLLRGRPSRGATLRRLAVGVVGGGNSAGPGRRLARARRCARHAAASPRRPARDDVRLPRATSSSGTASRFATRARSRTLHGDDGQLEAVTLKTGERLPFSFLFLFLGALPCTEWLGDAVARDEDGFRPHGRRRRRRLPARDERPGRLRGRRRAFRLDQAVRRGSRRRIDGRAIGARRLAGERSG